MFNFDEIYLMIAHAVTKYEFITYSGFNVNNKTFIELFIKL